MFITDVSGAIPDAPGVAVAYAYDLLNRLVQTTRDAGGPNQSVATMQYDALGRKSAMTDPNMGSWEYEYDAAGNITKQRDALILFNSTTYTSHQIFFRLYVMNRIEAKYSASPQDRQHSRRALLL